MIVRQLNLPTNNFTMIPNRLVEIGLSSEAVGTMCILAVHDHDYTAADVETACGYSKKKRQRIFNELQAAGLLQIRRNQGTDGRWQTVFIFDWNRLLSPETQKGAPVEKKPSHRRPKKGLSRQTQKGAVISKDINKTLIQTQKGSPGFKSISEVQKGSGATPDLAPIEQTATLSAENETASDCDAVLQTFSPFQLDCLRRGVDVPQGRKPPLKAGTTPYQVLEAALRAAERL